MRPVQENNTYTDDLEAIGRRIRQLRMARGLTLADVADRANLSTSMISAVERGRANSSVGTLIAIAEALGVKVGELFEAEGDRGRSPLIRRDEQRVVQVLEGLRRRVLLNHHPLGLELAYTQYQPGVVTSASPVAHRGWEVHVVLEGQLEFELDGHVYPMTDFDTIAFSSTRPHRASNPGPGVTRVLVLHLSQPDKML